MNRSSLIARKHEVHQQIQRLIRQLDTLRAQESQPKRQMARLEREVERLMAEEYNLRVAIDRSQKV